MDSDSIKLQSVIASSQTRDILILKEFDVKVSETASVGWPVLISKH